MKKTDHGLVTIAFAAIMGSAIALAIASDITAPICKAAAEAVPKDKFDFGCLEFWLNRYQSLLGNLITAAVAGATLLWVARQLTAANRQAAVAASQGLREIARELEAELATLQKASTAISEFSRYPTPAFFEFDAMSNLMALKKKFEAYQQIIDESSQTTRVNWYRGGAPKTLNNSRYDLFEYLDEATIAPARVVARIRAIEQRGLAPRDTADLKTLFDEAQAAAREIEDTILSYTGRLQDEVMETWDRIRSFEGSAVHGRI